MYQGQWDAQRHSPHSFSAQISFLIDSFTDSLNSFHYRLILPELVWMVAALVTNQWLLGWRIRMELLALSINSDKDKWRANSAALKFSCHVLETIPLSSRSTLLFCLYKFYWQYHMPGQKATFLCFFFSRAFWWHSHPQHIFHPAQQNLPASHDASISSVSSLWFRFHSLPYGFFIPLPVFY